MLAASKHPSMVANVAYIIRQSWPTDCRWIFDTIKLPDNSSRSYERSDFSICQIWISLVQSGLAMVFEHFALSYFFGGCSFGEI